MPPWPAGSSAWASDSAIYAVAAAGYALPSGLVLVWLLRHPVKARPHGGAFTIGRVTVSIAGK